MKVLALPRQVPGGWNTLVIDPKNGEFIEHDFSYSIKLENVRYEKVFPNDRQLRRIRRDIDRYLKNKAELRALKDKLILK